MRDDGVAVRFDCHFKYTLVARIAQHWPPQEIHLAAAADTAQIVNNGINVGYRHSHLRRVPLQDGLVLDDQRHGNNRLEASRPDHRENLKRSPIARAKSGDKDIRVDDHTHENTVSHTIPIMALNLLLHHKETFATFVFMKKQARKSADSTNALTTFSTRLTPEQERLVVRAAELRGWSVARLIRFAAIEKAAHIVNTSEATSFDFRRMAFRVARQLTNPEVSITVSRDSPPSDPTEPQVTTMTSAEFNESDIVGPDVGVAHDAERLQRADLEGLATAVSFGGTEFLRCVLDESANFLRMLDEQRMGPLNRAEPPQLPQPIDPSALMNEE